MKRRFTILSLLLCFLPACPSSGGDAPPPAPSAEASISLGAGPPGGLGGLPGNGLGGPSPGNGGPGIAAPGTPPVPAAPGNAPGPGGPGAAQPASPGGGYGKAQ